MAKKEDLIILNAKTVTTTEPLVALPCTCPECGKVHYMGMSLPDYKEYSLSQDVLKVFGEESSDDRELLILGTCPECWDRLFKERYNPK